MPEPAGLPSASGYRGRFAPSPTGPLHAGSVMAALASYLDARSRGGQWLLRIEDLDPPRESPAAADAILYALDSLGLHWDGEVLYQSSRHDAYEAALDELCGRKLAFACTCSRRKLSGTNGIYPGYCRDRSAIGKSPSALRCRVDARTVRFHDALQGDIAQQLESEVGDFIVRRKDGLYAYQLAVVVDDAWQGITDVVRGIDLLDSTPRQIYLQQMLGFATPHYSHIPVLVNREKQKLSKQSFAAAIDPGRPGTTLYQALEHLQQQPDVALRDADPISIVKWGIRHWNPAAMRGMTEISEQNLK